MLLSIPYIAPAVAPYMLPYVSSKVYGAVTIQLTVIPAALATPRTRPNIIRSMVRYILLSRASRPSAIDMKSSATAFASQFFSPVPSSMSDDES